eukprot:3940216-Alexandrium_andersonii.AAC.1
MRHAISLRRLVASRALALRWETCAWEGATTPPAGDPWASPTPRSSRARCASPGRDAGARALLARARPPCTRCAG